MRVEKTVFISYRRTNVYNALAIYQNLIHHGYDVFFDYDSIKSGDFAQIILNQIAARAHFVVLLTPSALERCNEPGDWLRREIEHAIELKRNIIPLMFEGFSFKDVDQYLTGKIAVLKSYNAMTVPIEYFDAAMEKLRNKFLNVGLEAVIHPTPAAQQAQVTQIQAQASSQPKPNKKQISAEEWLERANQKWDLQDWQGVIDLCGKAIRLNPNFTDAYVRRSGAKINSGKSTEAFEDADIAIRLNPEDTDAYYNRGIAYEAKGDLDRAIADYTKAIQIDPQDADANNRLGMAYDAKGDLDRAIADYTKAIQIDPQFADAYYNRGTAYEAKGDLDRAIADYTKAIQIDPQDADAYYNRGAVYKAQGNLGSAIADYTKAIQIDPQFADAYRKRGIAHKAKGDLDSAIADYTEAIHLNLQYPIAYRNRGVAYEAKGDLRKANADYRRYIDLGGKEVDKVQGWIHENEAELRRQGK